MSMLIHWKTLHIYKFVLIEKCSVINWSLNFRKLAWLQWLSFRTRIRRKFLLKNYFLKINWHSFTFKWVHKLDFQRIFSIFRHLDFLNYAQLNDKFENQCQSIFFFFFLNVQPILEQKSTTSCPCPQNSSTERHCAE